MFFLPDVNQFSIITELLGTPPDDVIETIASENVRSALYLHLSSHVYPSIHLYHTFQILRHRNSPSTRRSPDLGPFNLQLYLYYLY